MPVPRPIPGAILSQPAISYPDVSALTVAAPTFSDATLTGDITVGSGSGDTIDIAPSGDTVGFFGATAVAQQSALTAEHADLTQAGTDNADTTIQAATNVAPYGFANADEFEAVVATLINMKTRVAELEAVLQAFGLLA